MSERSKLNFGDLPSRPKRPRPDIELLREVSQEHGFLSRDPASAEDGEGEGAQPSQAETSPSFPPVAEAATSEPSALPPPSATAETAAPPEATAPVPLQAAPATHALLQQRTIAAAPPSDPLGFRRRGRPPSDRLYPMNIKVSQEVAQKLYAMRDTMHRATFADVIETLLEAYEHHNGPIG